MLAENMNVGQEVWFAVRRPDENGKERLTAVTGRVQEINKGKVVLEGTNGVEGTFDMYAVKCFERKETLESDMKWDQYMDDFQDKLAHFAEGYINKAAETLNKAKEAAKEGLASKVPQSQSIQHIGLQLKVLAGQFKEKVGAITDRFVDKTQEVGKEQLKDDVKSLWLHTDLSQYEPGNVTLEASDLAGIPVDDKIELDEADLLPIADSHAVMQM